MNIQKLSKKLLAVLSAYPAVLLAGPSGSDVVGGAASISNPSPLGTVIDQTSAKAIINWQNFSIAGDEYVQFNQPSSSSVTLNRVTGGDPSSILGNLSANGQVFLINPNGVYFGPGATLDVGGLVASTMDIRDEDFMNGNYVFTSTNADGASVVNDGIIRAREQGYVVLTGDRVENNGTIEAKYGQIALISGGGVTLDIEGDGLINFSVDAATAVELAGVENTGDLIADGGRVVLTGKTSNELVATAVNNTGLIQAHGIAEQNGEIFLLGEGGDIINGGTLDTSGTQGGDGGLIIAYTDKNLSLEDGSLINADGANGGRIRLIADQDLNFKEGSTISAQASNGSAGLVELSGHESLKIRGTVELGIGGQLLIDPTTLTVNAGAGNPSSSSSVATIGSWYVEDQLRAGTSVSLVATDTITVSDDIDGRGNQAFNSASGSPAGAENGGDLFIGIGTIAASSMGSATCVAGFCDNVAPNGGVNFTTGTGGTINLNSKVINIDGDLNLMAKAGTINDSIFLRGANVTLTANTINMSDTFSSVTADAGDLTINGNINATASSLGVQLIGTGNITLNGSVNVKSTASYGGSAGLYVGGNSSYGWASGTIKVNGNINVEGGTVGSGGAYVKFNTSGDVIINANVSASAIGVAEINIDNPAGESTDGAVTSAVGTGLLTAKNINVKSSGTINLKTNTANLTLNSSGASSAGDITIDNTVKTTAATIALGEGSLTAGNVKLGFGGVGTVTGDLTADSIDVTSPSTLNMLGGFDVGSGYSGVQGDQALVDFLAANGITDGNGTANPNASFTAGDTLNIDVGSLTQSNRYLYLKANTLNISANISSAPNLLVQMLPFTETNSIGFDATSPGAQVTNYTESAHFSKFTGTTIGVGGVTHGGGIVIGANGGINIGSKNLVFLTGTPFVQGVDNVTGTGIIGVISSVFPEVLLDEVGGSDPGEVGGGDGGGQDDGFIVVEGGGVKDNLNLSCS